MSLLKFSTEYFYRQKQPTITVALTSTLITFTWYLGVFLIWLNFQILFYKFIDQIQSRMSKCVSDILLMRVSTFWWMCRADWVPFFFVFSVMDSIANFVDVPKNCIQTVNHDYVLWLILNHPWLRSLFVLSKLQDGSQT